MAGTRKYLGLILPFLVVILCLSTFDGADQKPVATFKGQTDLVLIPTVVHDKSGAHIPGLTKDDFVVTADGQKRAIAVFEEVKPGDVRIQRAATKPGDFTNMVNGQLRPNRLTVIALDLVNTPELRQEKARQELLKVLAKTIQTDSMVALILITSDGTRLVHDFTSDPHVLMAALQHLISSQSMARDTRTTSEENPIYGFGNDGGSAKAAETVLRRYYLGELERKSYELERKIAIHHELAALEQIAQGLRGIPGRKSLIWAGGGFPFSVNGGVVGLFVPYGADAIPAGGPPGSKAAGDLKPYPVTPPDPAAQLRVMLPSYERVWRILNDANVAVYGIDVRGITPTGDAASVRFPSPNEQARQRWLNWDTQDTFRIFADVTGGRAYTNTNDLERAYRESLEDSSAYYLLGYYVDRKKDKVGWHELNVKVNRPGADVRARKGFFLRTAEDKETQNQEMDVALRSPLDYTGLPVMGRWAAQESKGAKRKVSFALLIPANGLIDETSGNHIDLDFYVRVLAPDGTMVAHTGQEMEGRLPADVAEKAKREGIRYEGTVELPPGVFTAHFVVRDKISDRIGSVTTTMKVSDGTSEEAK